MKTSISLFLLFSAVFLIYSNTFDASWHLDDYQNIIHDARVHLTRVDPAALEEHLTSFSIFGRDSRPLSRLSFALNWYVGRDNPFGYHLVNITLHIISSLLLFFTIMLLFRTPKLENTFSNGDIHLISLLSTALWAVNPIQTQAVTYIVQRMALLSAFFYLLSLCLYICGRLASRQRMRTLAFAGCFVSFLLGVLSKENAATIPVALLLVEFIFFQDLSESVARKKFIVSFAVICFGTITLGTIIFVKGNPLQLLSYGSRYFSPWERLLTESRVLIFYLTLIFYPVPTRLSIEHDISISTSLFHPWTTLPCMIIILLLVGLSIWNLRRRPLLSFPILFFFLNHVIESSIIGLELVFEHRNYLPTLFIFVPISLGLIRLLDYCRKYHLGLRRLLMVATILIVMGFASGTFIRNLAWKSEKSLWEDAVSKAPMSSRALHNLAQLYYEKAGQSDAAMLLYRKALQLEKNNTYQESVILNNIAANYFTRGNFAEAAEAWEKAWKKHTPNMKPRYFQSLALVKLGKLVEANQILDEVMAKHPSHFEPLNLKGLIKLVQKKYNEALPYFRRCLESHGNRSITLTNIGATFFLKGDPIRAKLYLQTALSLQPQNTAALSWLLKNALIRNDLQTATRYIESLQKICSSEDLLKQLQTTSRPRLYSDNMILPQFDSRLIERYRSATRSHE